MTYFYVDNNLLRKLFKLSKDEYEILFSPVFSRHKFKKNTYNFKSSPYLVLEAIGIRPTFINDIGIPKRYIERIISFDKAKRTVELRDEIESLIKYLFDNYKLIVEGHHKLSEESLNNQYQETLERYVTNGRWLYDDVVTKHIDDINSYRDYLSDWFSLEKTLSQNYQRSINKNVFAYLINAANVFFGDFRNNSFSKMYYTVAYDLHIELRKKDQEVFQSRLKRYKELNQTDKKQKRRKKRFKKLLKLKNKILIRKRSAIQAFKESKYGFTRDNVDSEMIHLLLFVSHR